MSNQISKELQNKIELTIQPLMIPNSLRIMIYDASDFANCFNIGDSVLYTLLLKYPSHTTNVNCKHSITNNQCNFIIYQPQCWDVTKTTNK